MPLLTELDKNVRVVARQVYIAGAPVEPLNITIDLGYDNVSASASVQVASVPDTSDFRQELEIWLGWNGFTIPCFKGYIEDDGRTYFPFDNTIRAAGFNKKAQAKYPDALSYSSQSDGTIVTDLLTKAGIVNFSVDEDTTVLGVVQAVKLSGGTPTWDLINQIDQVFGYRTFDTNDGFVRRMRVSGLPSSTAAFAFVQGTNILSISRRMGSVDDINNQVNVYGLPQESVTWPTTRQAVNVLVPNPPQFIAHDFRSDLIETGAVASAVAIRLMTEVNGLPDEVSFETWGHPFINPGMTVSITSEKVGLASATNYWVKHVSHQFNANGFYTRLTCERRIGDLGEEVGKNPIAAFTYRVTRETLYVAGTPTLLYTVTADGSASWDPDGSPSALTFAWANNKNSDVSTATTYGTAFTQAEMDNATKPTITLTVTDATARTGSKIATIDIDSDPINVRGLYIAASERAEATADGGATWGTFTPAAGLIISTPEIANGYGLWGANDGKLYHSADALATTATTAHDFGSAINCIWVHESNPDRVLVGCADGTLNATNNMTAVASSTWTVLQTFGAAVNWVVEGLDGLIRVAMSNQVLISYDGGSSWSEQVNFSQGTAKRLALSPFGNYGSANSTGTDTKNLGTGATVSGSFTTSPLGLTHHIRSDMLYEGGTGGTIRVKQSGTAAWSTVGTTDIGATAGHMNHMVRDGDNQLILYTANVSGAYKTFTGGNSWNLLRPYTSAGLDGLMIGYDQLALVNPAGEGLRAVIGGRRDASAPMIAYTDNIFISTSPTWVATTNNLPATGTVKQIRLDPFNPSQRAVAIIGNSVYRNLNYRAGTSWTVLYNPNSSANINEVGFSIAEEGRLYVYHDNGNGSTGVNTYVAHTHDFATASPSFTNVLAKVQDYNSATTPQMAVGQWNADKIWVLNPNNSNPDSVHKSTDGGHTWLQQFSSDTNEAIALALPYEGNPSEDELFLAGGAEGLFRAATGGAPYAAYNTSWGLRVNFSPANSDIVYSYNGSTFFKSTDRALTFSTSPTGTTGAIKEVAMFQDSKFYIAGHDGGGSPYPFVRTSTNGTTWTDRTGNLTTLLGTATDSLQVNTITVDSQS